MFHPSVVDPGYKEAEPSGGPASCQSATPVPSRRGMEEHTFGPWNVSCSESHILQSKCSTHGRCESSDEVCSFCLYSRELHLPHLPDMVFPDNRLFVLHGDGFGVTFEALDALKHVRNGTDVKVACAEAWKKETGDIPEAPGFDWTFTSDYKGTLVGGIEVQPTDLRIDKAKLQRRDPILFYKDISLYEDELHDSGVSYSSVKIRVNPGIFYILLRNFVRVDGVKVKVNDTRLYHVIGSDHILREFTCREAGIKELDLPVPVLNDVERVVGYVPVTHELTEKLAFPVKA